MDQTLTHTDWEIWRAPQAAVGSILWRDPALQSRYDSLLREICEKTLRTTDWPQFTEQTGTRLWKACSATDPETAKGYQPRIAEAAQQVRARLASVSRQIEAGNPALLFAPMKPVPLGKRDWTPQLQNEQADSLQLGNRDCLQITRLK